MFSVFTPKQAFGTRITAKSQPFSIKFCTHLHDCYTEYSYGPTMFL